MANRPGQTKTKPITQINSKSMCKCIKELEKKMVGREVGSGTKKRKVLSASMISGGLIFGASPAFRTSSIVECTLEGQKKPYEQNVLHAYCPFCGEKYPEINS